MIKDFGICWDEFAGSRRRSGAVLQLDGDTA